MITKGIRLDLLDSMGRRNRKLEEKNCVNCGKLYRPWAADQKYCSKRCQWDNNGKNPWNKKPVSKWINRKGYVECRIWVDDKTQIRVKEHRYVMEQHIGRKLLSNEDVHHKDGNKQNNHISNLEIIYHGDHSTKSNNSREYKHGYKLKLTEEQRKIKSENSKRIRRATLAKAALIKAGQEVGE